MKWFKRLFTSDQKNALYSAKSRIIEHALPGVSPSNLNTFEDYARDGYEKNIISYRCINLVSQASASIDVLHYKKRHDGQIDEIESSPILNLLKRPNIYETGSDFREGIVSFLLLSGNAFVLKLGKELWVLSPDKMSVEVNEKGHPIFYVYCYKKRDGGIHTVKFPIDQLTGRSDVLHIKLFNPRSHIWGFSPIQAASLGVNMFNELQKWNYSLVKNGAKPSGFLKVEVSDYNPQGEISENALKDLREQLDWDWSGGNNAGRPKLLQGGLKWEQSGLSPSDMDWVNSKNTSSRDIALAFGVPSQLVNVPGDQTFANYREARMAFYIDTVIPMEKRILNHLTKWLIDNEDEFLFFDEDRVEALAPLREKKWEQVQTATFLTLNEKRESLGYGRYQPGSDDPGDMVFVAQALTPIDDAALGFDFSDPSLARDDINGTNDDEPDDDDDDKSFEIKTQTGFNLTTESQRQLFRKRQERAMKRFENSYRRELSKFFTKQGKDLIGQIHGEVDQNTIEMHLERRLRDDAENLREIMKNNTEKVARFFGSQMIRGLKHLKPELMETKDAESRFESFLQFFIDDFVGNKITNINSASRKRVIRAVRKEIGQGLADGETAQAISKRLETLYDGFTKSRSITIARTEVHSVSEEAKAKTAKALSDDLDLKMKKVWISTVDHRSRGAQSGQNTDHISMNGEKVDIDEPFEVPHAVRGMDLMSVPGDKDAPADQVINCRCASAFEVED